MNTSSNFGGLVSLPGNLESPRQAKSSEFGSGNYASGPAGMASGQNQLVKQTMTQEGPMHTQDSGDQTPSVWGKADFPVAKNAGEGGPAGAVKCDWTVNLASGQISPDIVKYPA